MTFKELNQTIEAFMPDGKFRQCGTSHNLGQGFGKVFNIQYLGKDEKKHIPSFEAKQCRFRLALYGCADRFVLR